MMPGLLFRLNRSPPVFTSQSKPGGSIKPNHHPDMSICDCYDLNQNYKRLQKRTSEQRLRAYNNEVQETYLHFAKDALWIPVKRYVILETSRLLRPASTPAAESS